MGKHKVNSTIIETEDSDFEPILSRLEEFVGEKISEEELIDLKSLKRETQKSVIVSNEMGHEKSHSISKILRSVHRVLITVSVNNDWLSEDVVSVLKNDNIDTIEQLEMMVNNEVVREWVGFEDDELGEAIKESEDRIFNS